MYNSLKYFCANKRKVFSILLIMTMTVFSVYIVMSIVQSIFTNVMYSGTEALNDFSIVYPVNDLMLDEDIAQQIKNDESVEDTISVCIESTKINNIFGSTSGRVAFLKNSDIDNIFQKNLLVITEGKLPEDDTYEIIMHENMLKNKDLSVGDEFGNGIDSSDYLYGKYKIVGSFTGRSYMAFGTKSQNISQIEDLGGNIGNGDMGLIIYPKNSLDKMNSMLDNIENDEVDIETLSSITERVENNTKNIKTLMFIIVIIIAVCISVALCIVLQTMYNERTSEFAILFAMGYKTKSIIKISVVEIVFLIVLSWILGIVASFLALNAVKTAIYEPMGQPIEIISTSSMIYTFIVLLVFSLITIISISIKLSKKDLISIIEMR